MPGTRGLAGCGTNFVDYRTDHFDHRRSNKIGSERSRECILHLAAIRDAYRRRIVGWSISNQQFTKLIVDALEIVLGRYPPAPRLTLHHGRGSPYRSLQYGAKAAKAKIARSMSRPSMPYDNAMIESFFANLKLEINDGRPRPNREAARTAIFDYIELFYNRARLYSALGYTTHLQIEQQYQQVRSVP